MKSKNNICTPVRRHYSVNKRIKLQFTGLENGGDLDAVLPSYLIPLTIADEHHFWAASSGIHG